MRNYEPRPLFIRNNYLLKWNLTTVVYFFCLFLLFIFVMCFIFIPESIAQNDTSSLIRQKSGVISAIASLLLLYVWSYKELKYYFKYQLFIKIYNDRITYDYISSKTLKTFTLLKADIKSIKWGFFPYSFLDENNQIWMVERSNDKIGAIFVSPIVFVVSCIYQLLYCIVNFKIEKYVLIRFKGGIMAIPKKEYPSNEKIKFEWRTLLDVRLSE